MEPSKVQPSKKSSTSKWTNIQSFLILMSLLFFSTGFIESYTKRAVIDLQRRFAFDDRYSFFLNGLSDVGLACCVIFAGYYGNNLHRPKVIGIGVCITIVGLLCFVPQVQYDNFDPSNMTALHGDAAICTGTRKYYSQCDIVKKFERGSRFVSLLSLGQFLIGCGQTLWTILGLMYIDDNCDNLTKSTHFIGILISMKFFGQSIGALLGFGFGEINENLKSGLDWIGAWWLGFAIITGLLFFTAIPIFCYPRFIIKRAWIWSGYRRVPQKTTTAKRKPKSKANARGTKKNTTLKRPDKEESNVEEKEVETTSETKTENSQPETIQSSSNKDEATVIVINVENGNIFERNAFETLERDRTKVELAEEDASEKDEEEPAKTEETSLYNKKKVNETHIESQIDQTESISKVQYNGYVNEGFALESSRQELESNNITDNTIPITIEEVDESNKEETDDKNDKIKKAEPKKTKRRRRFKKYKLRDIFDYLLKLLKNPYWILIIVGTIISAFTHLAYFSNLPHYLIAVFMMEIRLAFLLSGLVFGVGTGLGIIFGLFLTTKYLKTARRFTIYIISISLTITCIAIVLLAFRCNSPEVKFYADRGIPCYCEEVEFERICTSNGTYFSACHAGCKEITNDGNYANCSSSISDKILEADKCSKECKNVGGFLFVAFILAMACGSGYIPVLSLILRTVERKQKSLSFSCVVFAATILGSIPGQASYREIIISNCNQKYLDCRDNDLCISYNTGKIVTISNLLAGGLQSVSGIFFVGLLLLLRYKKKKKSREEAKASN
ncbi:DgyrCDS5050 [Dimorphilus gyrociliatus]|uniref:DgyrCDS5050 n=1 Tax=Dimorphilus gyrociliatus TaxID=2664684 RepID=A0A7I8VL00_9ANNE|nr:DgyrCDS5050 [Dimorphilus gyrociliatus]